MPPSISSNRSFLASNSSFFSRYIIILIVVLFIVDFNHINCDLFKLTIIHNNDFHANYLPIKFWNNAECYDEPDDNDYCVGGVSRTVAKVKEFRKKTENILFLNGGDHFQGTSWYTFLKSNVVSQFVRLMEHDAMALGNHEFDDGPPELVKFIQNMNGINGNGNNNTKFLPIVCCNIDIEPDSPLNGLIEKSIIRNINGTQVAIIGYLTPQTKFLSNPGKSIKFRDEIESIEEEIQNLKQKHPDLKIFIALGHSGYDRDIEIAEKISDLDLVVGGHSHTFLYSGPTYPSAEKPAGKYPTIIEHHINTSDFQMNKTTLVVQAFAYGKYLGWIEMLFDENGNIIEYRGEPIFLNYNMTKDPETENLVQYINQNVSIMYGEELGETTEELSIEDCRHNECLIGNLITDSFVDGFNSLDDVNKKWNKEDSSCDLISVINSGNIRTSIDKGVISFRNIMSTLPFGNDLGILRINGSELLEIFYHSANQHDRGGFLQVSSSIRVTYQVKPCRKLIKESEFVSLKIKCQQEWSPVETNNIYHIVMNNFMVNGGDNYTIDSNKWSNYQFKDSDLFSKYIKKLKIVTPKIEGRIQLQDFSISNNSTTTEKPNDNGFLHDYHQLSSTIMISIVLILFFTDIL